MGGFFDRALLKYRQIRSGAVAMPARAGLRINGAQVVDNDAEDLTEITISGSGNVVRTLSAASGALSSGDWVCPLATDPTQVTKGTPAVALAVGAVLGCVSASYSPGATNVTIFTVGQVVAASAFGDLGSGTVSRLQMTASGRAFRQLNWSGGEIRLGSVDINGNVTVDPYVPIQTAPVHTWNPVTYGAPWDGKHSDSDAWDLLWAAVSNDPAKPTVVLLSLPVGRMGYCDRDWRPTNPFQIAGQGGGTGFGNSGAGLNPPVYTRGCGFRLATGRNAFLDSQAVSPSGGQANESTLAHLDILSTQMRYVPGQPQLYLGKIWEASTQYYKGDCRIHSGNQTCFFRANSDFVSNNSGIGEPGGFTGLIPGVTFSDGTGGWTAESYINDYIPDVVTAVGDRREVPGTPDYYFEAQSVSSDAKTGGVMAGSTGTIIAGSVGTVHTLVGAAVSTATEVTLTTAADHGLTVAATVAAITVYIKGTSGFTGAGINNKHARIIATTHNTITILVSGTVTGAWSSGGAIYTTPAAFFGHPAIDSAIVDNHVTWVVKAHSIVCRATTHMYNMNIQGFSNRGVIWCGDPSCSVDFSSLVRARITQCGAGWGSYGSDAHGGDVTLVHVTGCGLHKTVLDTVIGTGPMFSDTGDGGNVLSGNYAESSEGPGYLSITNGDQGNLFGNNSECVYANVGRSGALVVGESSSPWHSTPADPVFDSNVTRLSSFGSHNLYSRDDIGAVTLEAFLGREDGKSILGFVQGHDAGGEWFFRPGEALSGTYPAKTVVFGRNITGTFDQVFWFACPGASLPSGNTLPGVAGSNGHMFGVIEGIYFGRIDVGAPFDPVAFTVGTAAPASLYRTKGSLQFDQAAGPGGRQGWRTTVAGSPGTQVPFGPGYSSLQSVNTTPVTLDGTNDVISVDCSGGAKTVRLPATPVRGQRFLIVDAKGSAGSNNITIDGNGNNIRAASTLVLNASGETAIVVYDDTNSRWLAAVTTS